MDNDYFLATDDPDVGILLPPSCEAIAGVKICGPCLAPRRKSLLATLISICAVTPLTNLTVFSLDYQLYLHRIFHRLNLSFYSHALTMPLVNLFLLAIAAEFKFDNPYGQWLDASFVAVVIIFVWYCLWGLKGGVWWMGPAASPILSFCYLGAHYYQEYGSQVVQPLVWVILCSGLQCLSHVMEDLPPRVGGSPFWTRKSDFFCRGVTNYCELAERAFRVGIEVAFCGTLGELVASPRLLPLFWSITPVYNLMKFFNLESSTKTRLDHLEAVYQKCLVPQPRVAVHMDDFNQIITTPLPPIELSWIGEILKRVAENFCCHLCDEVGGEEMIPQPALDYIGVGGGRYLAVNTSLWDVLSFRYCIPNNVTPDMFEIDLESAIVNQITPLTCDSGVNQQ